MTLPSAAILSTVEQVNPMAALLPVVLLALGAAAATALGVFRRGSIVGPPRLAADEPLQPLAGAAALGLGVWLMGQAALLSVPAGQLYPGISDPDNRKSAVAVTADLLARVAAVPAMVAMIRLRLQQPRRLGFTLAKTLPGLGRGVLGAVVVLPIMMLSLLALDALLTLLHHEQPYVHDLLKLLGSVSDVRLHVVLFLSILLAAPISEELFFRGCLQTLFGALLERNWPRISPAGARWTAVILTALLFASVHPLWSAAPIFVLALCLGYAYERTGNLWTSIAIHALFNAAEVAIYLSQQK
jgi:membrane protease YdiL (CAAX protease family)